MSPAAKEAADHGDQEDREHAAGVRQAPRLGAQRAAPDPGATPCRAVNQARLRPPRHGARRVALVHRGVSSHAPNHRRAWPRAGLGILPRSDRPLRMCLFVPEGTVIVIGGAEDKVRDRVILSRFVALAGGRDATIAVISTASSLGPEAGVRYRAVFGDLGAPDVRPLHVVHAPGGQRGVRGPPGARRERGLPDRRQPAAAVVDHRRHAPRGGHRCEVQGGRGRRRHERRCVGDEQPHDRVRRDRRDPRSSGWPRSRRASVCCPA